MKRILIFSILIGLFLFSYSWAGSTAYQSISYSIQPINEIWVSGNPPTLVISQAVAGEDPEDATDSSTTYTVATNEGGYVDPEKPKRITGSINQAMPDHTKLIVNLEAPVNGYSEGDIELGVDSQNLVTGILSPGDGLTITYKFKATAEAGTLSGYRTVTFTLLDDV
jgi:hypothetical protein